MRLGGSGCGIIARMRSAIAALLMLLHGCRPARPSANESTVAAVAPPAARGEEPAADGEEPAADGEEPAADGERCTCPADPAPAPAPARAADAAAAEARDEAEDSDARKRRVRAGKLPPKALVARLRAAFPDARPACDVALSGPCNLRGDLDGDGAPDDLVLVRSGDGAGGLAILFGAGAAELLGAGTRGCWTTTEVADEDGTSDVRPCPTEIEADLGWIARWELRPRRLRDGAPVLVGTVRGRDVASPAPGAVGDGVLLAGSDAAAVLYRSAAGWTLMHLGF